MSAFNTLFWKSPPSATFWGSSGSLFWQTSNWTQAAVGSGTTGSFSSSAGTYTVAGTGLGVTGTSDSLYFVNQLISGNFEIIAYVSAQTSSNAYAIAGLMLSDSATPGASNQCALIGVSPQNGVNFTARTADGSSAQTTLGPSIATPVWLRLVVSQSYVSGYQSSDGIQWELVGQATMSLPTAVYTGFAVSSNSTSLTNTATFSNVYQLVNVPQLSMSFLPAWSQHAIGGAIGSFVDNLDGSYTIAGNGPGVTGTSDALFFVGQETAGNVEFSAEIVSITTTAGFPCGGLMITDLSSVYPTASQCLAVGLSESAVGLLIAFRTQDSITAQRPGTALFPTPPVWIKVVTQAGIINTYHSSDGVSWNPIQSVPMSMPANFYIGFVAWSDATGLNTVTIQNISATQTSSMLCWLRSDVGIAYSGSSVSGWTDQSAAGNPVSQPSLSNQPSLVTGAINGLPAVSFNGTTSFLSFPSGGFSNFTLGLTWFLVIDPQAITAGAQIVSLGVAGSNAYELGLRINSSSQLEYFVYDSTGTVVTTVATGVTATTGYQILIVQQTGTTATVSLNQQTLAQNNSMNALLSPAGGRTNNYLGQSNGGGNYFHGQLAELLFYQRSLTTFEEQTIVSYLQNKFAL